MIQSTTIRTVLIAGSLATLSVAIAKGRTEPTSAVVADLESKIDFLARRVANLERNAADVVDHSDGKVNPTLSYVASVERPVTAREAGLRTVNQVTAPSEVVDRSGKPSFVVADAPHATVAKRGRIQIARTQGGNTYSLVVRTAADVPVAGIGDMSQGGGLYIADAKGTARVSATGEAGLELFNAKSSLTAHLTTGPRGAGQLWLYDDGGRPMVKAGTISEFGGVGVVQVGPGVKCVPMGTLRVPDCMRGPAEQ